MKNIRILQYLNIVGLIMVLLANVLANALPINGQTTSEISNQYENLFTPAGYTFSIWAVIYIGLAGFAFYQSKGIFDKSMSTRKIIVAQLGLTFFISCLANAAWIYAWHYEEFSLTIILMASLLLSLIDINRRIFNVLKKVEPSMALSWMVRIPFGLYLGWICVASVANTAFYLTYENWSGLGISEVTWTMIMIFVSGLIGLFLLIRFHLVSAALAIFWGILGILAEIWQDEQNIFVTAVSLVMLIVLVIAIFSVALKRRSNLEDRVVR